MMLAAVIVCMPMKSPLTRQVLRALDEARMAVLPHTALLILSFQSTDQPQVLSVLSPTARRATLLLHVANLNTSAHHQVNLLYR